MLAGYKLISIYCVQQNEMRYRQIKQAKKSCNLWKPKSSGNNSLMNQITGEDSDWRKLKPHQWCHICLGIQISLWSEFKKSPNRAVTHSTEIIPHSVWCMPRGDSCRKCWHHNMLPGQHEDWASSPVALSTRRKERGTAGSCYVPTQQPPPTLVLKDANSLLTSGTGVAIAAHVALSGGYIWNNININRGFHPGTAQSCQVKNEGEHTSVQGTQASMFLDYIHFCYETQ